MIKRKVGFLWVWIYMPSGLCFVKLKYNTQVQKEMYITKYIISVQICRQNYRSIMNQFLTSKEQHITHKHEITRKGWEWWCTISSTSVITLQVQGQMPRQRWRVSSLCKCKDKCRGNGGDVALNMITKGAFTIGVRYIP
jgi:hypothetical protein